MKKYNKFGATLFFVLFSMQHHAQAMEVNPEIEFFKEGVHEEVMHQTQGHSTSRDYTDQQKSKAPLA